MIRVIVEIADAGMAANVGGPVHIRHQTFDLEAPEVEKALASRGAYDEARVIGVEVLPQPPQIGVATATE